MKHVGNNIPSLSLEEDVAITTLVGMHGNENKDQWEEFVNNDMDRSPTSDEDLIYAKYSFDGRVVFSLFDKMVHFKEQSTLWEDSFKASNELCRTKDVQILDLVHRVTGLEKIIVETEKIIGQKDQLIKDQCSKFTVVLAESIFNLDKLKDMYQAQKKKKGNYRET